MDAPEAIPNPNYLSPQELREISENDIDADITLSQKLFDEKKIYTTFRTRFINWCNKAGVPQERRNSVMTTLLCYFAGGYWGANKAVKVDNEGVSFNYKGTTYNMSRELDLQVGSALVEARDENVLTASKVARLGVTAAYVHRKSAIMTNSPVVRRSVGWRTASDKQYLQIHGYFLPLKRPDMSEEEKVACLAINFYNHYHKARPDIKNGLIKKFIQISNNCGIDGAKIVRYSHQNQGDYGSNNDLLASWLKADTSNEEYATMVKEVPFAGAATGPNISGMDLTLLIDAIKNVKK